MGMMLSEIYASVKTAQQYYEVGGYSGSVLLKVKLSSPQKDKILPVMGDSLYGFSDNSSLFLSDYEFVFTTDTLVLSDQKKRLELFDSICSDIYTGFGIGSKYNFATIRDYMSKNSGYSWGDDFKTS